MHSCWGLTAVNLSLSTMRGRVGDLSEQIWNQDYSVHSSPFKPPLWEVKEAIAMSEYRVGPSTWFISVTTQRILPFSEYLHRQISSRWKAFFFTDLTSFHILGNRNSYHLKFFIIFSSFQCVLQVPPISSSMIWSAEYYSVNITIIRLLEN
jgi:hypothetical protein